MGSGCSSTVADERQPPWGDIRVAVQRSGDILRLHLGCVFTEDGVDVVYREVLRAIADRLPSLVSLRLIASTPNRAMPAVAWQQAARYMPSLVFRPPPRLVGTMLRHLTLRDVPLGVSGLGAVLLSTRDTLETLDATVHNVEYAPRDGGVTRHHRSQLVDLRLHFRMATADIPAAATTACRVTQTVGYTARATLRCCFLTCDWGADDGHPLDDLCDRLLGRAETTAAYDQLAVLAVRLPRLVSTITPEALAHIVDLAVRRTDGRLQRLILSAERCRAASTQPWPAAVHPPLHAELRLADGVVAHT